MDGLPIEYLVSQRKVVTSCAIFQRHIFGLWKAAMAIHVLMAQIEFPNIQHGGLVFPVNMEMKILNPCVGGGKEELGEKETDR